MKQNPRRHVDAVLAYNPVERNEESENFLFDHMEENKTQKKDRYDYLYLLHNGNRYGGESSYYEEDAELGDGQYDCVEDAIIACADSLFAYEAAIGIVRKNGKAVGYIYQNASEPTGRWIAPECIAEAVKAQGCTFVAR